MRQQIPESFVTLDLLPPVLEGVPILYTTEDGTPLLPEEALERLRDIRPVYWQIQEST